MSGMRIMIQYIYMCPKVLYKQDCACRRKFFSVNVGFKGKMRGRASNRNHQENAVGDGRSKDACNMRME